MVTDEPSFRNRFGKMKRLRLVSATRAARCFAEARHQLGADALDLRLRRLAVDRDPARDRPAAEVHVVGAAVAVAERLADAVAGQQVALLGALHLDARNS